MSNDCILHVSGLSVAMPQAGARGSARYRIVDQLSFRVTRGHSLGIVGESGSGKTTTALAVARLVPIESGTVEFNGVDISTLTQNEMRAVRRNMQFVFQDPTSALSSRMRAGEIVREPLDVMDVGKPAERDRMVGEMLLKVGLKGDQRGRYPHELSGGQRQRLAIARAFVSSPELVICDEPVSSLDMLVQAQVLNLLRRLKAEGVSLLFISHDLGVVQYLCDDIVVMHAGKIVEISSSLAFFSGPKHPYSRDLLAAVPSVRSRYLSAKPSDGADDLRRGCSYSNFCSFATERCRSEEPRPRRANLNTEVACHLY